MEIQNKLTELILEQEGILDELQHQFQTHFGRLSGFQASLSAVNGDDSNAGVAFRRKIGQKRDEEAKALRDVQLKIVDAAAKKSAFEDTLKFLPKDDAKDLRPLSELAKIRDLIRAAGKPLTLNEILTGLNKSADDKKSKISLRSSLRRYADDGRIFTKEIEADTFGLLEFKK